MAMPFAPDPILLTVPVAGNATGFVLRVPKRGSIRRLRLVQLGGTATGFTYALYSRYVAMRALVVAAWVPEDDGSSDGSSTGDTPDEIATQAGALPAPPEKIMYNAADGVSYDPTWDDAQAPLYRITPVRTVEADAVVDDPDGFGLDLAYANNDYQFRDGARLKSTNMPPYLYLVVTVAGVGTDTPLGLDICIDDPTCL